MGNTKRCSRCEQMLPLAQFSTVQQTIDGYRSYCKDCYRIYQAEYRNTHIEERKIWKEKEKQKRRKERWAKRGILWEDLNTFSSDKIWEIFSTTPCADCGCNDPIVLEFDHVRGKKSFNICAGMQKYTYWNSILQDEVAKCEVVCCNCHRKRTFSRQGGNWRFTYKRAPANFEYRQMSLFSSLFY